MSPTKILMFLIITLIACSCQKKAKNNYPEYYRKYNQVLKLEKDNKINDALQLLQEAEEIVKFVPVRHLLKGRNFAILIKDCELAESYFQKTVNNGFEYEQFDFVSKVCPKINNSSVQRIDFNNSYKRIVDSIFQLDQIIRSSSDKIMMEKVDASNMKKLLTLIEDIGYPYSKLIGERSSSNAFILMLHFDSDIGNKKLKPIIEKAYSEGKISPENYAWIIDRRRNWGPEKLDPYYYQLPTEKYFELTNEEIAEIDAKRYSIGLKPLSEMNIIKTESGRISIQF